jgi:BirA family transcriptional regulator, biotin operon repressor / biotin---[acetyl-CoA-carboxylase] ligase
LRPDKLTEASIRRGMKSSRLGMRIYVFEETDSTNARAIALAREGAGDGTLVLAETQTLGRGRMGRIWHSPTGVNLYFSLILRPSRAAREVPWLGLASGDAVARGLAKASGLSASVKWPNDVQLSNRKVAGILLEQAVQGETADAVILGIGVNVNVRDGEFPPELTGSATSLRIQTGRTQDRTAVLHGLLESLEEGYATFLRGDYRVIRENYLKRMGQMGERVRVQSGDRFVEGVVSDLADDGALVLRLDGGRTVSIHAGESTGLRPA